ncbi:MAG: MOSC domain-containing protein [Ignavibacteriaceae bacterium]|nr:MOSC domain-containing protein [Ignavibacteriaceae bacterium]
MKDFKLTEIFIYPIKSLGGISLQSAKVEERGLQHDRRWMLVDKNGMFLTQREHPQMAMLQVNIRNAELIVTHKVKPISGLQLPISNDQTSSQVVVNVWNDVVIAKHLSKTIDEWFSDALGLECQLVRMANDADRITDSKYTPEPKHVSFADAYPLLIIGQESLNELNRRLKEPLPMNRFRPNFVFSGGEPFAEDSWKDFLIGELKFKAVKPCSRCVVTTIDQHSAEKGKEPLETLSKFRKVGNKVMFGMNVIGFDEGIIKVGSEIIII